MAINKKKIIIISTIMILIVSIVLITYFTITVNCKKTLAEITLKSYDERSTLTFDVDDNIETNSIKNGWENLRSKYVKFNVKNSEKFINKLKSNPEYQYTTIEYAASYDTNSEIGEYVNWNERHFFLYDKYYYSISYDANEIYICNLVAEDATVLRVPFINSYFEYYDNATLLTFNYDNNCLTREGNYINSYEDLKKFYSNINSDFYVANDEEKTISIKLYDTTKKKYTKEPTYKFTFTDEKIDVELTDVGVNFFNGDAVYEN